MDFRDEQEEWHPYQPLRGSRKGRRGLVIALLLVSLLALAAVVGAVYLTDVGAVYLTDGAAQFLAGLTAVEQQRPPPATSQREQLPSSAVEQKPTVSAQQQTRQADEDTARLMKIRERRETAKEQLQGVKLSSGQTAEPSFMDRFGWWITAALILSMLVAGFTRWTAKQTVPIVVGVVILLLILQNWWLLLIVVALLVVILVITAIRNILAGGVRGVHNVARGLPAAGLPLFIIIWEIIQTFWTHGTIGDVLVRQAAQQPPAQNP